MSGLFAEQYRPKTLSDVIGQDPIRDVLQKYVEQSNMPHLMFSGPAGTGKTTCALALVKDLYGDNYRINFLELNASDDRGISVVRDQIKDFAKVQAVASEFKVVFLDECDNMTRDAQQALRRTMEKFSKNTRFILSCNYPNKVIAPIQDRCTIMKFRPLKSKNIREVIESVGRENDVVFEDQALDMVVKAAHGSMRSALNLSQMFMLESGTIDAKQVQSLIGSAVEEDQYEDFITMIRAGDFKKWEEKLYELYYGMGLSIPELLEYIYKATIDEKFKMNAGNTMKAISAIGNTDYYITIGTNELLQLKCLFSRLHSLCRSQNA